MTTTATATCAARFPMAGGPDVACDRRPHGGRLHTGERGGVEFCWSDPDDDPLPDWEAATLAAVRDAYGDDLPPTAAARIEAIGCALITLQAHQWLSSLAEEDYCRCWWRGDDHERHVAEQLWTTGALDRHAAPVAEVVAAARAYADRQRHTPDWAVRLTTDARRLVVAVDALGGGS